MTTLTKPELFEMLLKRKQTDKDVSFLMSLDEKDLLTLLVALRERIGLLK